MNENQKRIIMKVASIWWVFLVYCWLWAVVAAEPANAWATGPLLVTCIAIFVLACFLSAIFSQGWDKKDDRTP